MDRIELDLNRYSDPPEGWATSLANNAEVIVPCLDAIGARSVAEVGAYAGDLTELLVDWAALSGARVVAVDPSPQEALVALAAQREQLELVRRTSLEALPEMELTDAIVIDGDHNYWTVGEELRLIGERAPGADLPLLLFHDVCWPHARRDDYFDAEQIPADHRHPLAGEGAGIYPGDPGTRPDGLPYPRSAAHEGGPRNGVRTAVEDFVAANEGLVFATVPAFFGLGVVWHSDAPWADRVAAIVGPWDDNDLVARLETGRVRHLVDMHGQLAELWELRARVARQEEVLRRMLDSTAFSVAERLSRLRVRAGVATTQSEVSKDQIRRALD